MPIAVTWIQGVLRVATGSAKSMKVFTVEEADYPREDFPAGLLDALQRAKTKPDEVLLSTDSPLLIPLMEEIPPATLEVAQKLLRRRAEKAKLFNEPIYCGLTAEGTGSGSAQRYLLHVTPEEWVKAMDRQLDAHGYHLAGFFPAALALAPVLKQLPGNPEEPVLLAADAESGLLQVLGRRDGTILFYRTLAGAEGRGGEGLLRELRRMTLFAEQRRGLKVREIYFSGRQAAPSIARIGAAEGVQLLVAPAAVESSTYLRWLMRVSPRAPDNTVPRLAAMRTRARRLRVYVNLGLAAFAALGLSWLAGRTVERNWKIDKLRQTREEYSQTVRKLKQEQAGLVRFARDKEILRICQEEFRLNVPGLLFRNLSAMLPAPLELSSLKIWADPETLAASPGAALWKVELTGRTKKADTALVPLVRDLVRTLQGTPWQMRVLVNSIDDNPQAEIPAAAQGPGRFYLLAEFR